MQDTVCDSLPFEMYWISWSIQANSIKKTLGSGLFSFFEAGRSIPAAECQQVATRLGTITGCGLRQKIIYQAIIHLTQYGDQVQMLTDHLQKTVYFDLCVLGKFIDFGSIAGNPIFLCHYLMKNDRDIVACKEVRHGFVDYVFNFFYPLFRWWIKF